jgi:glycosyltransferase involved in cell wall biosynthesis
MVVAVAQVSPDLIVGLHMNRTFLRYVRCARKLGVPIVLSEHIDPHFPERLGANTRSERLTAFHGAARIHLLADAFRDILPDYLKPRTKAIPNTVPPALNLANPANGKKRNTLITVARLVPRKNMARLIEEFGRIAKDFPKWKLQILGDGERKHELMKQASTLGISGQVEFVGEVSNPYDYLENAQCFVLPSLFEGFPMSSLEAMAHGLPVVGYKICNGINVQVVYGENGRLVEESSREGALAEALSELFSDRDTRVRMGQASLARYNTLYSNEVVFDQWERLFLDALNDPKAVGRPSLETVLEARLDEMVFGAV